MKKILWLFFGFVLTIGQNKVLLASSQADENSDSNIRMCMSPVTPSRIYALEERLVHAFHDVRQEVLKNRGQAQESRETLRLSFQQFRQNEEFAANYEEKTVKDHTFYLPRALVNAVDTPQKKRLREGKSFTSPVGKSACQGHHVDQEDADEENPALIWVLTRTNHQALSGALHLPANVAGSSHISRSKFRTAKQALYKEVHHDLTNPAKKKCTNSRDTSYDE